MATALEGLIREEIGQNGPMPVARFMELCLYHPQHGYYTRGLNFAQTPPRDFTTAPEISPIFGAVLANWVEKSWRHMGAPEAFALVEAGPGRGSLMLQVLTALQEAFPPCYTAAQPLLLEVSPALREIQKHTLGAFPQCRWGKGLEGTDPVILLGNELLDAFPVQPYQLKGGAWYPQVVKEDAGALALAWSPMPGAPQALPPHWQPEEGAVWEDAPMRTAWLHTLRQRLQTTGGAALLVDYGAATLPPQGAHTLQAVRAHAYVPLLETPGEADLTAHVPFGAVAEDLGGTCTLEDMGAFLLAHGLVGVALKAPPKAQNALQRLLHPAQMGTLFQVLCCTYPRS